MLEKLEQKGQTCRTPDSAVIFYLKEIMKTNDSPVYYEVGVGIGATILAVADVLSNRGKIIAFSRESDLIELAKDLQARGFSNIDSSWGSPNNVYSGYHFELARGAVSGLLPKFDLAYLDGGHAFHLDAGACCVLKELCKPGGYILLDDYCWSMAESPTINPSRRPLTAQQYDSRQINCCQVELVCKIVMDTDSRFEPFGLMAGDTAVYRRRLCAIDQ